jgi:hypothetical protein
MDLPRVHIYIHIYDPQYIICGAVFRTITEDAIGSYARLQMVVTNVGILTKILRSTVAGDKL